LKAAAHHTPEAVEATGPLIQMEGVAAGSLADANAVAVEGINWNVNAGDYWVVAGLQGSGKSDFLMMTAGLTAPTAGVYRLFGEPMPIFDDARLPTRLRLGLVFDGGQLFHHLTVWENVALPLRYHRNLSKAETEAPVRRLLESLELGSWANATPGALGRSWQKRAGLARALSLEPDVLLIDNPLAGLDLRQTNWWLDFLGQLAKGHPLRQGRPVTLVVTTADLRPWKGRAGHFAVLKNKQFVVLGSWQQLEAASDELRHELLPAEENE
jgi:ABC-type transporter Mla maintaining outer membrane lipid asymmetry ATPase subunit MlaF